MPRWFGGSSLNPDEIVPPRNQWMDQFFRVKRWHDRVSEIREKSVTTRLSNYDFDTIIAFFENCYHLRDWLEATRPSLENDLKTLFSSNFEMGACRDLCHGYKHKKYMNPTHDSDFNLYRGYDPDLAEIDSDKNPETYNVAFSYKDDIKKYDVFDLADFCFNIWISFLMGHGLIEKSADEH